MTVSPNTPLPSPYPASPPPDIPSGPFSPNWESLQHYTVPDWYLDGKFGIFIHWGVYSVPAFGNEWYPRQMYIRDSAAYRHHLATYGPHTQFGYKDFIPRFTAHRFSPTDWVSLFVEAGAKFVVPVAEHHDGFAMYNSARSDWTVSKMGPQRDIIGELASATRAVDLIFGLSSHRAEHWWFFDEGRSFPSDVQDPRYAGLYGPAMPRNSHPDAAFLDDWLARCCELVDLYQPQLFWFDWWIEEPPFAPYLQRFAAYYYNRAAAWGKGVAINYKHQAFPEHTAVFDVERGQLTDTNPHFWQTDTSISKNSWGYIQHHQYKTAPEIIGDLVDIVSKNGALLLNIGPRADGSIPDEEQQILRTIGAWLRQNGEAIYGARPWRVYGEGPTTVIGGSFKDTLRQPFTHQDIRFTQKGNSLYAIALNSPPDGSITIQSLSTSLRLYPHNIGSVTLLGSTTPLHWLRNSSGLHIQLPSTWPSQTAIAFRIEPDIPST